MATPRTGNRPGRPRKHAPIIRGDKPGPVPVPFMERGDDRYVVATYLAMKRVFPKGSNTFVHMMYGHRVNAENVPLPARVEARKKCPDGYATLFFRAKSNSAKGNKIDALQGPSRSPGTPKIQNDDGQGACRAPSAPPTPTSPRL
jgi:hypothetical protein